MKEIDMSESIQTTVEEQKSAPRMGEAESWRQIRQDIREEIMAEIREGIREEVRGNGRENGSSQPKKLAPSGKASLAPAEAAWPEVYETAPSLTPMFSGYIYALGTVSARFPSLSLEKEYIQAEAAVALEKNLGAMTPRQKMYAVFTYQTPKRKRERYRYIAQQMCWLFSIESIESYILQPSTEEQLSELIDMLDKPFGTPPMDVDVVVGVRGPVAPPQTCGGMQLPLVRLYNTYSFPVGRLVENLPKPQNMDENEFQTLVTQVFYMTMQLADNMGNMDEHRALNYVILQYENMYVMVAEQAQRNCSLTDVQVQRSPLSDPLMPIMDVIFSFTNNADKTVTNFFTEVDVTGMYPFLNQPIQPYYRK
ncbi:MAG: hypothetical protein F6J93_15220 [Oscillatoria sp. SIO1A7]|nr:hypothetical protein [Oscillatoria sp. SIO1A7]